VPDSRRQRQASVPQSDSGLIRQPRLPVPTEISGDGKQSAMQDLQPIKSSEVMLLVIGSGGEKVSARR
jgi:hypothetical protein